MANLSEFANFFIEKKKKEFENDLQMNKTLSEEDQNLYFDVLKCSLQKENDSIKNTALLFLVDQIKEKTLEISQLLEKLPHQTSSMEKFNDGDLTSDDCYIQIIQIINSMENLIPKAVESESKQKTKIEKRKRENVENPEEFFKYPEEYLSIDILNNFYEEPIDGPISNTK